MDDKIDAMLLELRQLKMILLGNGVKGVVQRIDENEKKLEAHEKCDDEKLEKLKKDIEIPKLLRVVFYVLPILIVAQQLGLDLGIISKIFGGP